MYLICIYTHVHTAYNYTFRIFRFVSFAELGCRLQRLRVEVVVQNWGNVPNAGESVRRSTSSNLFNILPLCFVQDSWNVRGHPHPTPRHPPQKKHVISGGFPKATWNVRPYWDSFNSPNTFNFYLPCDAFFLGWENWGATSQHQPSRRVAPCYHAVYWCQLRPRKATWAAGKVWTSLRG